MNGEIWLHHSGAAVMPSPAVLFALPLRSRDATFGGGRKNSWMSFFCFPSGWWREKITDPYVFVYINSMFLFPTRPGHALDRIGAHLIIALLTYKCNIIEVLASLSVVVLACFIVPVIAVVFRVCSLFISSSLFPNHCERLYDCVMCSFLRLLL